MPERTLKNLALFLFYLVPCLKTSQSASVGFKNSVFYMKEKTFSQLEMQPFINIGADRISFKIESNVSKVQCILIKLNDIPF